MSRFGIIFTSTLAFGLWGCQSFSGGGEAPGVRVARVEKADLVVRYLAAGHVISKTLRVGSPEAGLIAELAVQPNSAVKKGQLLFRLEDQEARQQLLTVQAELQAARAKAEEAAALLLIRSQQSQLQVRQSLADEQEAALRLQESAAGASREERLQMREALRQAEIRLRSSDLEFRRQRQLFQEDVAARAELDQAESQYRTDQSAWREAQAELEAQRKGARPELLGRLQLQQQRAQLSSEVARQHQQEELLLSHRVETAQAEVQRLEVLLEQRRFSLARRRVVAPREGVVSQILLQAGENVGAQQAVVALVSAGPYWIEANVDEQDAAHVAVGQGVQVQLTSLPGQRLKARVARVAPSLEPRPQGPSDHKVLQIRVEFAQQVPQLRAGLEADVEGTVALARDALSLPRGALVRDRGQDFVQVVESGALRRRSVRLGAVSSDRAQILEGLQPGQEVIVEGAEGLKEGERVQVLP